ncbi:MAG: DUF4250 domain-containing protein [Lachnospiraceae bacterium]|nr:DUF4250 domain-containing protein [Lachnospiraceae bacterium]
MELPKDEAMLLSFVNMKLRDQYASLDDLCRDLGADKDDIVKKLASIDYEYDSIQNRFV